MMTTHHDLESQWASMPWGRDVPMPVEDVHGWKLKFPDGSYFRVFHDGRKGTVLRESDEFTVTPTAKPDERYPGARKIEQKRA